MSVENLEKVTPITNEHVYIRTDVVRYREKGSTKGGNEPVNGMDDWCSGAVSPNQYECCTFAAPLHRHWNPHDPFFQQHVRLARRIHEPADG